MVSSSVSVFAPYPRPGGVCRHDDIRSRTCDRRVLLARAGVHAPWKPSSALIPTLAHTRYTTPGTLVPLTPTLPFRSFNWPTETARRNRQPPAAQINHKIAFFSFWQWPAKKPDQRNGSDRTEFWSIISNCIVWRVWNRIYRSTCFY